MKSSTRFFQIVTVLTVALAICLLLAAKSSGYSRRLRSPIHQERYLIQSLSSVDKKNFHGINCGGLYSKSIFSKLDKVCDDCYSLYKEPEIHSLCRMDCFNSNYFKKCVNALMLQEQEEHFTDMVKALGK